MECRSFAILGFMSKAGTASAQSPAPRAITLIRIAFESLHATRKHFNLNGEILSPIQVQQSRRADEGVRLGISRGRRRSCLWWGSRRGLQRRGSIKFPKEIMNRRRAWAIRPDVTTRGVLPKAARIRRPRAGAGGFAHPDPPQGVQQPLPNRGQQGERMKTLRSKGCTIIEPEWKSHTHRRSTESRNCMYPHGKGRGQRSQIAEVLQHTEARPRTGEGAGRREEDRVDRPELGLEEAAPEEPKKKLLSQRERLQTSKSRQACWHFLLASLHHKTRQRCIEAGSVLTEAMCKGASRSGGLQRAGKHARLGGSLLGSARLKVAVGSRGLPDRHIELGMDHTRISSSLGMIIELCSRKCTFR